MYKSRAMIMQQTILHMEYYSESDYVKILFWPLERITSFVSFFYKHLWFYSLWWWEFLKWYIVIILHASLWEQGSTGNGKNDIETGLGMSENTVSAGVQK